MKKTGLNELRESYLTFFEGKDHLRLPSAPLIPKDDSSILLINAGMTPLKKYFQGIEEPPRKRVASCQKCIRTPDIENVGFTSRHGTYFEMLGNFSFGDYFKSEACAWAWEYFIEVLEIPEDLLWVSVYEEDDETAEIWVKEVGVNPDRIVRFGKADNFWEHGSGPCGPCSEIYFDRGADKGCKTDCKVGCDCDRYIEVWNLVFTQFDSDGKGNYTPLANKNIDTGMGLERLACVMQGADSLFEVDTVQNIMKKICEIIGKTYKANPKEDVSIRIMTDHIRSTSFMIGDGVLPSNEGRGYVLRRLLRRAARHGRLLGYTKPFLYEVCDTVIDENLSAYPELGEKRGYIKKTIKTEEESFAKTVEKGLEHLNRAMCALVDTIKTDINLNSITESMKIIADAGRAATENINFNSIANSIKIISGDVVFKLHDTFGFPVDLTREILNENNFTFDEAKFNELMQVQKDTARANQAFKGGWDDGQLTIDNGQWIIEFIDEYEIETKILELVEKDDYVITVLEKTPFYAESGGQTGDTGYINGVEVLDTKKTASGLPFCICEENSLKKGDAVTAKININRRRAIMRNHTSAHLLQSALRTVLGEHVQQAGSLVDDQRCRFDFTHGQALTPEEITKVESFVNSFIIENNVVEISEMPIEDARKMGAVALFGEKYGAFVRVVKAGNAIELCGGCHVKNTAEIGLFKIISEASVAAGVRRIEAVTGLGVLDLLSSKQNEVHEANEKIKQLNSAHTKEIARLNSEIAKMQAQNSKLEEVGEKDGIKLLVMKLAGANGDALRQAGDKLKSEQSNFAAVFTGESNFYCVCDKNAVAKGFNAGNIVREISAVTGGRGGGRPDGAMAGIGDASKVDEALNKFKGI
ncbi:MAG: alanine--tRNA ligase [Oscillospiraceae bacterium]|nr:alanine--tRNA ligase [Oscillospiraceae bacterium]